MRSPPANPSLFGTAREHGIPGVVFNIHESRPEIGLPTFVGAPSGDWRNALSPRQRFQNLPVRSGYQSNQTTPVK